MNKKVVIGIIVAIVVIAAGVWVFMSLRQNPNTNTQTTDSSQKSEVTTTVTYTDNGFSPDKLEVKVGDTIRVMNKSTTPLQFSSDDHPTHFKEPELNLDTIGTNEETSLKVTHAGEWGFHNHLKSGDKGTLTVKE